MQYAQRGRPPRSLRITFSSLGDEYCGLNRSLNHRFGDFERIVHNVKPRFCRKADRYQRLSVPVYPLQHNFPLTKINNFQKGCRHSLDLNFNIEPGNFTSWQSGRTNHNLRTAMQVP